MKQTLLELRDRAEGQERTRTYLHYYLMIPLWGPAQITAITAIFDILAFVGSLILSDVSFF